MVSQPQLRLRPPDAGHGHPRQWLEQGSIGTALLYLAVKSHLKDQLRLVGKLMGDHTYKFTELTDLIWRGLKPAGCVAIVRFIYYPGTQNKNYVFTFLAFNTVIYFRAGTVDQLNPASSVGVGPGPFAILLGRYHRLI